MSNNTVLSVCIPTYNRKELLLSNVYNILTYERDDLEVVVLDNASTDQTWEALNKIEDIRLHIYRNEKNLGAAYNYGKAPMLARGKYIMVLNDRDNIDISEIKEFIDDIRNKEVDIIITPGKVRTGNLKRFEEKVYWRIRLTHPGYFIYNKKLWGLEEIWKNIDVVSISMRDLTKIGDYFANNIFYSNEWYCYKKAILVKHPTTEALICIKQERVSSYGRNYFTFDSHYERLKRELELSLRNERNRKEFVIGTCQGHFYTAWRDYIHVVGSGEALRYNYTVPRRIWWLKEMFGFYRKIILYLKEKEYFSFFLAIEIMIIFVKEYTKCLCCRVVKRKQKYFPEAWIKKNYL